MLGILHTKTARWLNRLDGSPNRRVWCNYRETKLSYKKSYFARLSYVHQNAVKHGVVPVANQYPWCSAPWFEGIVTPAMAKSIYRFKTDLVKVDDEFAPVVEW